MADAQQSLTTLRDTHRFPGAYIFKVIGDNEPALVTRAVEAMAGVLGARTAPKVGVRRSQGGRHQAISLEVHLEKAEQVLQVYASLRGLAGVRYIL